MLLNIDSLAATASARNALRLLAKDQLVAPAWSLFLDKFSFEQSDAEAERDDEEPAKTRALRDVRALYNSESVRAGLAAACGNKLRWLLALEEQLGSALFRDIALVNDSRLLVHLGRASVLENVGLCFDRTTGLPWIPGTAVKGVLSTWALWEGYFGRTGTLGEIPATVPLTRSWVATNGRDHSALALQIFGDDSPAGSQCAGDVVFVGGFPDAGSKLGLDIVNPHYEEQRDPRTGRVNVRDKRNLTPNMLLVIEAGTAWHFVFYLRSSRAAAPALLDEVERWLKEALINVGLGAKTAAGFGRFRELKPNEKGTVDSGRKQRQDARERARDLQKAAPEDRAYIEFVSRVNDWDTIVRDLAQLDAVGKAHTKRFLATEEGRSLVGQWQASRGGRRQIQRLQEAGLL